MNETKKIEDLYENITNEVVINKWVEIYNNPENINFFGKDKIFIEKIKYNRGSYMLVTPEGEISIMQPKDQGYIYFKDGNYCEIFFTKAEKNFWYDGDMYSLDCPPLENEEYFEINEDFVDNIIGTLITESDKNESFKKYLSAVYEPIEDCFDLGDLVRLHYKDGEKILLSFIKKHLDTLKFETGVDFVDLYCTVRGYLGLWEVFDVSAKKFVTDIDKLRDMMRDNRKNFLDMRVIDN